MVTAIFLVLMGFSWPRAALADPVPPTTLFADVVRLGSSGEGTAIYRIHATAGSNGAAFGLGYRLPGWPSDGRSVPRWIVGSPITIQSVRLNGAGSMRRASILSPSRPEPDFRVKYSCRRGRPSAVPSQLWVEMPPESTSVIELEAEASFPSWPETRYAVEFFTFSSEQLGTVRMPLATLATSALSPRGVRMLTQIPNDELSEHHGPRWTPEVVGTTHPPSPLTRIAVRVVRPSRYEGVFLGQWMDPSSVPMSSVETDLAGRFRISPVKLKAGGRFAFLARIQERPGKTAADWICGPFFSLRGSGSSR